MSSDINKAFNSYHNNKRYCQHESNKLNGAMEGFCGNIENISVDVTKMHKNTFDQRTMTDRGYSNIEIEYLGPGVLDVTMELKGSVDDLPFHYEYKTMLNIVYEYVFNFLTLISLKKEDFLAFRILYLDGNSLLIDKVVYSDMAWEYFGISGLMGNPNWKFKQLYDEINRVKEVMGLLNESKMSEFDLESYKNKHRETGNDEWLTILDRFPEQFQREIIDERPEGSKTDINLIKNWELNPNHPIEMGILNLIQTNDVKEAIGRTPRHVMEMIKTNPKYRLELKDVEHVSDTEVGRKYGLKSGEIFDQNPERYEEYANYDPKTAEPSTMVDGELWWGMGRLIAALLRGDMTLKVWSVTDNRGVDTDFTG